MINSDDVKMFAIVFINFLMLGLVIFSLDTKVDKNTADYMKALQEEKVRIAMAEMEAAVEPVQVEPVQQMVEEPVMEQTETLTEEQTKQQLENEFSLTENEIYFLEMCVEAEAGNQSLEGRQLVTDVILNRVRDNEYPDTVREVITQPYRFSSYWDGGMDRVEVSELTIQAVELELKEISYPGLFYFCEGRYSDYGTPWKKVGDHYFSTK